jgi:iron complex outermembrane receptor protein
MTKFIAAAIFAALVFAAPSPAQTKDVVVVTGTYEPLPLQESDRVVHVFDVRSPEGLLFESPADYLRLDSSVDLRARAAGGVQSDLSIRGGSFSQNLVLLNGIRLNDAQSAHHDLDLPIPLAAISQIQILRGSGSTQYGADAVTGVVNLLTAPSETPELVFRTSIGNFGRNEQSGSLSGSWGPLDESISGTRSFSSGFRPDRDYRTLSFASFSHLKTQLGSTDVLLSLSDRPFGADQFYGDYPSWERTKGWFAAIHQQLGKKTEVDLAYRRHTDLFVLFRDNPEIYTNHHADESWEGDIRRTDDLPLGAQLHYGASLYSDSLTSNNLGAHSRVYGAGYAVYDIRALKRFSLTAGLRTDVYGPFRTQVSPTVSGGAWLSSHFKLRASVSRAFRLPNYTDLYYHDPSNLGNPNLKPETAWNYEGGLDWHGGRKLRGSITVFDRRDSNLIDYIRYSTADPWQATNFDRLNFVGMESEMEWQPRGAQSFGAQYTLLRGSQSNDAGIQSKYAFNYPVHSAVVSWRGTLGNWIVARTRAGVLQRYDEHAYAIWDASAAWARGRVRPFIQLTNLAAVVYYEIPGVIMPPRGVVGGIEIRVSR